MPIPYQDTMYLARKALKDIENNKQIPAETIQELTAHYKEDPANAVKKDLADFNVYLVAQMMLSDTFDDAARTIAEKVFTSYGVARSYLSTSLLNGPAWCQDNVRLLRKNAFVAAGRYYHLDKDMGRGSAFEKAYGRLTAQTKDILDYAAQYTFGRKKMGDDFSVSRMTLIYTAVQLLPDGLEKQARLNALEQSSDEKKHNGHMTASARVIDIAAAAKGCDLSNLGITIAKGKPIDVAPTPQKPGFVSLSMPLPEKDTPIKAVHGDDYDPQQRMRALTTLVKAGKIEKMDGLVDLFMLRPLADKHRLPTLREAAAHFKISVQQAERSVAKVAEEYSTLKL